MALNNMLHTGKLRLGKEHRAVRARVEAAAKAKAAEAAQFEWQTIDGFEFERMRHAGILTRYEYVYDGRNDTARIKHLPLSELKARAIRDGSYPVELLYPKRPQAAWQRLSPDSYGTPRRIPVGA